MSPDEAFQHQRFLRLLTAHEPGVRAYVRRLVPCRADADDILQEVVIALWEKFSLFEEGAEFRPWAYGVAKFKVLSWLRDRGRDRLVLSEEVVALMADEAVADEPQLERQRYALELCAEKLEPAQRQLLMRAYQPNANIQAVAETSGRTVAGFYQWLYRVRRVLMECIQRELAKEDRS